MEVGERGLAPRPPFAILVDVTQTRSTNVMPDMSLIAGAVSSLKLAQDMTKALVSIQRLFETQRDGSSNCSE